MPYELCIGAQGQPCYQRKVALRGSTRCRDCRALNKKEVLAKYYAKKKGYTGGVRMCLGAMALPCPHRAQLIEPYARRCEDCKQAHVHGLAQEKNEEIRSGPSWTKPAAVRQMDQMPDTSGWTCMRCGCTDNHACRPIPCTWVGPRLCSSTRCATPKDIYVYEAAKKLGQLAHLLNGVFKLPDKLSLKAKGKEDTQERAEYRESVRRAKEQDADRARERWQKPKKAKAEKKGRRGAPISSSALLKALSSQKGSGVQPLAHLFKCSPKRMLLVLKDLIKKGQVKATSSKGAKVRKPNVKYFRA